MGHAASWASRTSPHLLRSGYRVSLKLTHVHPDLKGWEERNETVTSRFVRASGITIWFDGLTFRRREDGSLQGCIAIRHKDGPVKEDSFTYQQVKAG